MPLGRQQQNMLCAIADMKFISSNELCSSLMVFFSNNARYMNYWKAISMNGYV